MMKNLFFIPIFLTLASFTAQNNSIIINDNAFIVLDGGTAGNETVVVVDQINPNGIVTTGAGGNIITLGEFDYLKWNLKTGSGNYTIPFTTDVGLVKIPLSINVTSGGTGTGYMALSTWDVSTGAGQFDNTPWASDINHMAGADGSADVSDFVVDRFWVIDVTDPLGTGEAFGTVPTSTLSFGYNPAAAEVGDGNILTLGNLVAQQYNPATDKWPGLLSGGLTSGIYGTDDGLAAVSGVVPAVTTWFRTWTLADKSSPLPVELTDFQSECKTEGMILYWQTASEINNDYFEILKSTDGLSFNLLATIEGSGNSSSIIDYEYTDIEGSASAAFYKIVQVDFDGTSKEYNPIQSNPCISSGNINVYAVETGFINVDITTLDDNDVDIRLYDMLGKEINIENIYSVSEGFNKFKINYSDVAFGNYMLVVNNQNTLSTHKVVLK
jgi:hypothetical protein